MRITTMIALAFLAASPAYGDIGTVTSPAATTATPSAVGGKRPSLADFKKTKPGDDSSPQTVAPPVTMPAPPPPLLTITFDRRHVYFEKQLRQAVAEVESTHGGSSYEIVSRTPVGKTPFQNQSITSDAGQNIDNVLDALNELGVGAGRVHVSSESSDVVAAQEISIYVK